MVGSVGAQLALLAFAVAILAGLQAGNGVVTILTRALICMFIASMVGQLVAWMAKLVLRDFLQARKVKLDQAHVHALEAIEARRQAAQHAQAQAVTAGEIIEGQPAEMDEEPRLAKAS